MPLSSTAMDSHRRSAVVEVAGRSDPVTFPHCMLDQYLGVKPYSASGRQAKSRAVLSIKAVLDDSVTSLEKTRGGVKKRSPSRLTLQEPPVKRRKRQSLTVGVSGQSGDTSVQHSAQTATQGSNNHSTSLHEAASSGATQCSNKLSTSLQEAASTGATQGSNKLSTSLQKVASTSDRPSPSPRSSPFSSPLRDFSINLRRVSLSRSVTVPRSCPSSPGGSLDPINLVSPSSDKWDLVIDD